MGGRSTGGIVRRKAVVMVAILAEEREKAILIDPCLRWQR
jgi:hypothetical protein